MNQQATAALTREIADAGVGLARLARLDPRWPEAFDFSTTGFLRSFFAPVFGLPFFLVMAAMVGTTGGKEPLSAAMLWANGLGHVINVLAFPAIVALLARPFGFSTGYAGFVILVNWTRLFACLAFGAISPLVLLGELGLSLFGSLSLVIFAATLFMTWRASRHTLSPEIAPALLMGVLFVGVNVAADQLGVLIVRFLI